MKIAIYAGTLKKDQDGFVKTIYELLRILQQQRLRVGLWSPIVDPGRSNSGMAIHQVPSLPLPFSGGYRGSLPLMKAIRELDRFNPDVVHIATPDVGGYGFLKYARRRNLPIVATYHTHFPAYLQFMGVPFLYGVLWRYLVSFYNQCDRVYAPTLEMAGQLKRAGIRNVQLWGRGIHSDRYHPGFRSSQLRRQWQAGQKKIFLYAGRFMPYKGLDVFTKVYELFQRRNGNDVAFVLLGDGSLRRQLQSRMPRAWFPGYLTGKALATVYASSDILLFPSTTETFGNVVLEGLSSGLPAVVSDVGGCREIVENADAGLVATANDPARFFEACLELVENPQLYSRLRENGLKYAADQSWERINATITQAYAALSEA